MRHALVFAVYMVYCCVSGNALGHALSGQGWAIFVPWLAILAIFNGALWPVIVKILK